VPLNATRLLRSFKDTPDQVARPVCRWDLQFKNRNDETRQDNYHESLVTKATVFDSASNTDGSAMTIDTTIDWTADLSVIASGAITGTASLDMIFVEYGYIA
jgi:hypothetical protein